MTGEQQFEAMTMPWVNGLFQTALHLMSNRAEAGEVVRDVYAAARKSFGRYACETDWRLELYRLLIRTVRRRNRNWLGLRRRERILASANGVTSALARLPASLREILLLVDCQKFSYKEAAEVLGITPEKVAEDLACGRNHMSLEFAVAGLGDAASEAGLAESLLS